MKPSCLIIMVNLTDTQLRLEDQSTILYIMITRYGPTTLGLATYLTLRRKPKIIPVSDEFMIDRQD